MSEVQQFTGYAIELENREELKRTSTPATMLMMGELPERVDPRNHPLAKDGWLQVEDQGSIGSCQGNALTECAEYCYAIATGLVIQFSRMFAYLVSQMEDNIRSDSGSTLSGGARASEKVGFCPEKDAQYPSRYPGWGWVTAAMRALAEKFKLRTHTDLTTVDAVKAFIGSGIGIVQIGISWNRSMTPDANGCIRSFTGGGGGGHSVVFCGYVTDADIGQRSTAGYWLLLKNSWNKRWGKAGYAYVDPSAVAAMLKHPHTVMIGHSDMETPTPRPIPVDFTKPGNSMYA